MPASVFHALSMTTPNDTAWECQPQHFNSSHLVTLNAVGSEISGAFNNAGNVSFGLDGGGFITATANVTAAAAPVNVTGANGSSVLAQTIAFSNANGMTLGVSTAANGATVTGSYTVPTVPTAYVSSVNGSSGAISLNVGSSLSSSTNGSSITFGLASNITTALQSAGAYLTTAAQSNQVVNSINGSTGTFSFNVGSSLSVSTAARNITFGLASNITTALQSAGNYLTTARASNDAIGLNSAVSNVTATINSSGLSLDARGYAGTATAITGNASITLNSAGLSFNGSNLAGVGTSATNASITLNSNGLAISVAASGGGATPVVSAANGSYSFTTLSLSNANGFSFGTSAGSAITGSYTVPSVTEYFSKTNTTFNGANISGSLTLNTAGLQLSLSVAAPGAAAENNNHNLLGANTAGNTTASGSTIGLSGINLTLSGTNNSQIVISAPATSSLVGVGGISISSNGSTISLSLANALSYLADPMLIDGSWLSGQMGNGSVRFRPVHVPAMMVIDRGIAFVSLGISTSSNSSHAGSISIACGLYTLNGSTLSASVTGSTAHSWTNTSNNSTSVLSGIRAMSCPLSASLTPGNYWLGIWSRTSTANANWFTASNLLAPTMNSNISGNLGVAAAATFQPILGWGEFSATSSTLNNSYAISQISGTASANRAYPIMNLVNGTI